MFHSISSLLLLSFFSPHFTNAEFQQCLQSDGTITECIPHITNQNLDLDNGNTFQNVFNIENELSKMKSFEDENESPGFNSISSKYQRIHNREAEGEENEQITLKQEENNESTQLNQPPHKIIHHYHQHIHDVYIHPSERRTLFTKLIRRLLPHQGTAEINSVSVFDETRAQQQGIGTTQRLSIDPSGQLPIQLQQSNTQLSDQHSQHMNSESKSDLVQAYSIPLDTDDDDYDPEKVVGPQIN